MSDYAVNFEAHRRRKAPSSSSSDPSGPSVMRDTSDIDNPFVSTYGACNKQVHGGGEEAKNGGGKFVVGYRGHVPQQRFEHGSNFQATASGASDRVSAKIAESQRFVTTLERPEDVEAPYRPRNDACGFTATEGIWGTTTSSSSSYNNNNNNSSSNGSGGNNNSHGVNHNHNHHGDAPVIPVPTGYKGHVPGKSFEFGENFNATATRLVAKEEERRRLAAGAVHPREVGAKIPEPLPYRGKYDQNLRETVAAAAEIGAHVTSASLKNPSNINSRGDSSNSNGIHGSGQRSSDREMAVLMMRVSSGDGAGSAEGPPEETAHMRRLRERRERQEARRHEGKEIDPATGKPVVRVTASDEAVLSEPSYVRAARKKKEGPEGDYKIPGYSGHFGGKQFDLGASYGERTRIMK